MPCTPSANSPCEWAPVPDHELAMMERRTVMLLIVPKYFSKVMLFL